MKLTLFSILSILVFMVRLLDIVVSPLTVVRRTGGGPLNMDYIVATLSSSSPSTFVFSVGSKVLSSSSGTSLVITFLASMPILLSLAFLSLASSSSYRESDFDIVAMNSSSSPITPSFSLSHLCFDCMVTAPCEKYDSTESLYSPLR